MLSACPEHAISRSGHAPSTATSRTEHAPSIAPFPYPEEQDALTGGGDSPEDVLFRIPSKEGELEVNNVEARELLGDPARQGRNREQEKRWALAVGFLIFLPLSRPQICIPGKKPMTHEKS